MAAYSVNIRKPTPLLLAKKILSVPFNALACATPGKNYYFTCFVYLCLVLVPQGNYSPHVSTLNTVFPQYSGNMGHDPSSSRSLFPGEHRCSPSLPTWEYIRVCHLHYMWQLSHALSSSEGNKPGLTITAVKQKLTPCSSRMPLPFPTLGMAVFLPPCLPWGPDPCPCCSSIPGILALAH